MDIILSIGFSVTGFTLLILFQKRELNSVNKFASLLILLWFIRFLLFYVKAYADLSGIPWLYFIDQSLFFLDGVFLFWFSKSLAKQNSFSMKDSLHLIPFAFSLIPAVSLFVGLNSSELHQLYQNIQSQVHSHTHTLSLGEMIFILAIIIHNFIYLILARRNFKQYDLEIHSSYSTVDKIRLNWLPSFLLIWAILMVLPLVAYFTNYLNPVLNLSVLEFFFIASMVTIAAYFSLKINGQYYANLYRNQSSDKSVNSSKILNEEELNAIYLRLERHMLDKKPYLNESFSLSDLADQIGVKPTKLSSVLKFQAKVNFYNYVNAFRIEQVKKDLLSTDEQVIIIAYNNGFSSKSTFNKVFKDFTGHSPSEYRRIKTE